MTDDETSAAQVRAMMSCRHDICACGHITPTGQVVGDPLGEIGLSHYIDVLGLVWDKYTWDSLDAAAAPVRDQVARAFEVEPLAPDLTTLPLDDPEATQ